MSLALVAAVAGGGCLDLGPSTSLDETPCPPDSTLTYDNFGRGFLVTYCERCHSADAINRHGAPEDYTFDTVEEVRQHLDRIFANAAGDNTSMPPGPDDPPADQRFQLAEWLACGAP